MTQMGVADVETTVPDKAMASKKLKIKILAKKPLISSRDVSKPVPMKNFMEKSSSDNQKTNFRSSTKLNRTILGTKRTLEGAVELQKEKKLKMDRSATSNCLFIIGRLMKHRDGYIFSEPVDPIKLGIPDYFDIIRKPMDMGTIKKRLDQDMYKDVEEFESDVRLTFSNAMRYNPPTNWIHHVAKDMMTRFDNLWKPVKVKTCRQQKSIEQLNSEKSIDQTTHDMDRKSVKSLSPHVDKLLGQKGLSIGKAPEDSKDVSLKNVLKAIKDGKAEVSKSSKACKVDPDSDGLPHLSEESGGTMPARPRILHARPAPSVVKVKCENAATSGKRVPHHELKAVDVKITSASRLSRSDPDHSSLLNGQVKITSASRLSRSDQDHSALLNGQVKMSSASRLSRSDPDSDGCESCLDEEHACTSSVAAVSEGLENVIDIQLSPSKALRAAMLKSRFADTILKAQHLLQPGDRTDTVKLQQEKERLERRQREEKARIEAQIKAARSKAEMELKKQREQEREAARVALKKMERSVDLDDNFHVLRDLEALIGSSPLLVFRKCQDGSKSSRSGFDVFENGKLSSSLERLGLFIKAEYRVGDDEDEDEDEDAFLQEGGDWEEGEVLF